MYRLAAAAGTTHGSPRYPPRLESARAVPQGRWPETISGMLAKCPPQPVAKQPGRDKHGGREHVDMGVELGGAGNDDAPGGPGLLRSSRT